MTSPRLAVDINSDMGERPEAIRDGSEEELMTYISSANVACGGHAGTVASMEEVVRLAMKHHVCVGAHPSYPDRENFGRVERQLSPDELRAVVYGQVREFGSVCKRLHYEPTHVKPHGALYNGAAKNRHIALAIAEGVRKWSSKVILVGLSGSEMLFIWQEAGFQVAGEAFVDRVYESDGSLRSRKNNDALITDPSTAAARAVRLVQKGTLTAIDGSEIRILPTTLCVHSDTPGSSGIARGVRAALVRAGVTIKPLRDLV
ncbi:MAG: LamB/YcsF family protein [Ignavibacteriales bacterium]|nr:LamB/YcsF family protein [Ignavibacteriales bacterium]